MNKRMIKWAAVTPVAAVVALGLVGASARPKPPCAVASDWVAAHPDIVRVDAAELVGYTPLYRKAIYRAATAERRAQWWHEHFAGYLTPSSPLGERQRKLVTAMDGLVDSLFLRVGVDSARAIIDRHTPELESAFDKRLFLEVFTMLAPTNERLTDPSHGYVEQAAMLPEIGGWVFSTAARMVGAVAPKGTNTRLLYCNCNTGWQDCAVQCVLNIDEALCSSRGGPDGCGPFGMYACDGLCQP